MNPSRPSFDCKSPKLEDITAISWNRHHFQILAAASNNGNTVIWDLKNKKEIINIAHPGGRRMITGLAWNPESVC